MIAALIILAALIAVGSALYIHHRLSPVHHTAEEPASISEEATTAEDCCGQHAVCERDSLLAAVSRDIVYYDDEELDRFRGRLPESYTTEECETFRDVLLTLLPEDVAGWGRSIQLRGIQLPEAVRDEFLMMAAELRGTSASSNTQLSTGK